MKRRTVGRVTGVLLAAIAVVAGLSPTLAAAFNPDTLVSVGSPPTPFSQNKQNEPAIAVDANHPNVLVAGATGVAIFWTGLTGAAPDWVDDEHHR